MNTNRSKLLGGVLALVVAFSGVGFAGATLTMDATSVTGSAAVTINAAPASNVVIGSAATTGAITIGAATATAVSIVDDNWSITAGGVGTLNSLTVNGTGTTSGVGQFNIGTSSVSQTLNVNPGADIIGSTVNLLHSAGAGNNDNLYGTYSKVAISGDGDAGTTLVGDAPRAYIGTALGTTVASAAYASQPWVKHYGTGAVTAMSGLSALVGVNTDNFTATTVNAGHFHITGAATVTGQFDGVMIEAYPEVTSLDSMLALAVDGGATVATGIRITGSPVSQMSLSSGAKIFTGTAGNRADICTAVCASDAIGSMYVSTTGEMYIQVANAGVAADWEKITTTAAD
jgi:hypothetical protein